MSKKENAQPEDNLQTPERKKIRSIVAKKRRLRTTKSPIAEQLLERFPMLGVEFNIDESVLTFIDKLRSKKEYVLERVNEFSRKQNKTEDELALAIYLDVALKIHVFGIEPFEEGDIDMREMIAFAATEAVAKKWIMNNKNSKSARNIAIYSIFAPTSSHYEFLYDIWPYIPSMVDEQ